MKKLFLLLVLVMFAGSIGAQRTVQGIVRNDLKVSKTATRAVTPLDTTFSFADIAFWVGEGTNQAALVLSWHDGSTTNPDHMVWGYRWPAGETRTGLDMIKAVASADKRALLLIQYTGSMGYTINGIGYDEDPINLDITFDAASAITHITSYKYPANAEDIANQAITAGRLSGIINHPFNANTGTGYPAYDYDYWTIDRDFYPNTHWFAGWYNGYWSYFCRDAKNKDWEYSSWGASSRELTNGTWDAWSYNADMSNWEGSKPGYPLVAATFAPRTIAASTPIVEDNREAIYSSNELSLKNLKGYRGYITTIFGNQIYTFKINSDNETKNIVLDSGIYTFNAINGSEIISRKFVVK